MLKINNKVVYAWMCNDVPFYIGIGSIKRSKSRQKRNPHCLNKRKKAEREGTFRIDILHTNLSDHEACRIETQLISYYGRSNNQTGILTNMTDGGEGVTGYKHTEEFKNRQSLERQGCNNQNYGRHHTDSHKKEMRLKFGTKVSTPFGIFDSYKEASGVIGVYATTIKYRCKSDRPKYSDYYIVT